MLLLAGLKGNSWRELCDGGNSFVAPSGGNALHHARLCKSPAGRLVGRASADKLLSTYQSRVKTRQSCNAPRDLVNFGADLICGCPFFLCLNLCKRSSLLNR